jgi:polyisoprenyl-teichoic acid--peptidoglycan teichoic acid transferase
MLRVTMPRPFLSGLLSTVFPGAGQIYAGRVGRGLAIFVLAVAATAAAVVYAARAGSSLLESVVSLDVLLALLVANGVVLALRFWIAADAYAIAARRRRQALGRSSPIVAGISLAALAFLTVTPHAVVGWGTWLAYDTIDTVFAEEEPTDVLTPEQLALATVPAPVPVPHGTGAALMGDRPIAETPAKPEKRTWTTFLLIGGDAGYGRSGLRADTLIAVSVQSGTGRAAIFSVPRNLQMFPLAGRAGNVYGTFPDILNALYRFAQSRPELFPGGKDPGATALKQTVSNLLGIPIHYYLLVDLRGFVEVADALGGIRMTAPDTVDDLTSPAYPGEPWTDIQVTGGSAVKLDGRHALAYARSRSASSDYTRMVRQRCILAAMARRIQSMRTFRSITRLADAAKTFAATDIPRARLPRIVRLLRGIDPAKTLAVSFTPPEYHVYAPDIRAFRGTVQRLLHLQLSRLRQDGRRPIAGLCPQP